MGEVWKAHDSVGDRPVAIKFVPPVLARLRLPVIGSPLFIVCLVVLTGPVYFDEYQAPGRLKRWGVGNKVVAAIILGGWLFFFVTSLL